MTLRPLVWAKVEYLIEIDVFRFKQKFRFRHWCVYHRSTGESWTVTGWVEAWAWQRVSQLCSWAATWGAGPCLHSFSFRGSISPFPWESSPGLSPQDTAPNTLCPVPYKSELLVLEETGLLITLRIKQFDNIRIKPLNLSHKNSILNISELNYTKKIILSLWSPNVTNYKLRNLARILGRNRKGA